MDRHLVFYGQFSIMAKEVRQGAEVIIKRGRVDMNGCARLNQVLKGDLLGGATIHADGIGRRTHDRGGRYWGRRRVK